MASSLKPAASQTGEYDPDNGTASMPIDAAAPNFDRPQKTDAPLTESSRAIDEMRERRATASLGVRNSARSTARMVRGAGALLFAFETALLLALGLNLRDLTPALLAFHVAGVTACAVLFALTFVEWGKRRWRLAAFTTCAVAILAAASSAYLSGDPGALIVAILAILVTAGALLPWSGRWQAALGACAIGSFALLALVTREPFAEMLWLRVLIAVVLAQVIVMMITGYRRELEAQVLVLSRSDRRLRLEIAQREKAERRGELSAATTRTVFENLNDIAIIGTLSDHTFAMVNQAFETAFGRSRAEILGRPIKEVDFWVSAQQRERFAAELEAGRMVRNLEADFRLAGGRIITALVSGVPLELDGRLCGVAMIRDITSMSQARENLEQTKVRLRAILDASLDAISIYNERQNKFTYANQRMYHALGLEPSQVLGRSFSGLNIWADPETTREYDRRLEADGSVLNMEAEFRHSDGSLVPALISSVRTEIDGEPCVVSFTREITLLKQKERDLEAARAELARQLEALRASETLLAENEAKLLTIFNANRDYIAINGFPKGEFIDVNDEFIRGSGLPRDQIIGHFTRELGFWTDDAQLASFMDQLRAKGEVRNLPADLWVAGQIVPHLVSGVIIELGGNKAILTIARDISDFRAAQESLHQSEATLRKVFDANFDSITITDMADGNYLDVNGAFERNTGVARDTVIGKSFGRTGLWVDKAQRAAFSGGIMAHGSVRDMEADFRVQGGQVINCLISGVVLELGGKQCCLSITRDITALKRTEKALVAASESAMQASRAKSEFLSSMSHEIRTPMNSILGMADLLAETEMTTEQRHYVQNLVSNGHALLALLSDILDLAKVESGHMTLEMAPFDLRDVIEKSAEAVAIRAHEKGLELLVRIAPETVTARIGDPLRLRQILINLIGNAIKFTSSGEIMVSVEPDHASAKSEALLFTVRDTGVGIAADQLESIFMPFTQADSSTTRRYGGSGLGLAIVRRLADLMNASVWAESEPDHGSVFHFSAALELQPGATGSADRSLAGKRVLVAADNATRRTIMREMLELMGAQCMTADSGTSAIAVFEDERAHGRMIDAVVIDNRMRGLSGIDTANRMHALGAPAQAISLMLASDEISQIGSLALGSWMVKPIAMADLRATILLGDNPAIARAALAPRPAIASVIPIAPAALVINRPLRIMLADDSADNRILVRAYLKNTPYQLDEAENGRIAIDKFISRPYDLVLMDMQMPEVDGYTATRAIREWEREHHQPRTPILALTASALDENLHRTQEAGCDAHITKPVRKATLLEAIHRAAAGIEGKRVT
ncbi:MAG: PAS domain S-box protein [Candidatus Binataceae bacterium]